MANKQPTTRTRRKPSAKKQTPVETTEVPEVVSEETGVSVETETPEVSTDSVIGSTETKAPEILAETDTNETETVEVEITSVTNYQEFVTVYNKTEGSFAEKMQVAVGYASPSLKFYLAKLLSYYTASNPALNPTGQAIAKLNTDLYNTMLSVIRAEDENEFRTKLDILNFVFMHAGKRAMPFDMFKLGRGDVYWASQVKNHTFNVLCVYISTLCDLSKRKANIKTVSLSENTAGKVELTAADIQRLESYYTK